MSVHVLVPGQWSVQRGHDRLERIEAEIRRAVPRLTVFTHLEPVEDPVAWHDTTLERGKQPRLRPKAKKGTAESHPTPMLSACPV